MSGDCNFLLKCVMLELKKVKTMFAKVFNLMPGINETKYLVQHELYECKCYLNEIIVRSSKQK